MKFKDSDKPEERAIYEKMKKELNKQKMKIQKAEAQR